MQYMHNNAPSKSCQTKIIFQHHLKLEGTMKLFPIYILSINKVLVGFKLTTTTKTTMSTTASMLTLGFPLLPQAHKLTGYQRPEVEKPTVLKDQDSRENNE